MLKILTGRHGVPVVDDSHQPVDAVVDVREGPALTAAIDELIGSPLTMCPRNCVTTRELPSFAVWIESRPGPIQLNGPEERKLESSAGRRRQMTRSSSCLAQA